jgi:putative transposase
MDAYKSNFAKPDRQFKMKFKSRKQRSESIKIRHKCYKDGTFYPTFFGKQPIGATEKLPPTIPADSRLVRTYLNEFYLCIVQPIVVACDNQARTDKVVALDPGVRTFQTGYDPDGFCFECGSKGMKYIFRLCYQLDKIQSRLAKEKETMRHKKRYRLKRAMKRIRVRIRNMIDDCHKKLTKFLVENYNVILLPDFNTQKMVRRTKRKIGTKTARAMLTWSHYRFKMRLINKCREYPNRKVIVVDESYTSKTCGHCGWINWNLGANKTYCCQQCKIVIDRDFNAARNILIKILCKSGLLQGFTVGPFPTVTQMLQC